MNSITSTLKNYNVLEEVELIDQSIASTWNYWAFRMRRILPVNVLMHLKSATSLVLYIMQVIILITFIKQNKGDFTGVNTFLILLPTYFLLGLKLLVQIVGFGMAVENAAKKEMNHPIFNLYHELHTVVPVLEHLVPLLTYVVFLLCAVAIGGCHMNFHSSRNTSFGGGEDFCRHMNLQVVEALIMTFTVVLVLHNLFSIYTHRRHCSTLNPRSSFDPATFELRSNGKQQNNQLDQVAENLEHSMNWWKYRLSRIFSSNLSNNLLLAVDHAVEGGQTALLVRAVHEARGNLHNVENWSNVLLPLQLCFFLKFALVVVLGIYVAVNTFMESKFKMLVHLSEPKGWLQVAEYLLPLVTFLTFGLVTNVFARCFLSSGTGACKAFSFDFTQIVIIVVGIVQFLYHVRAMHNVHRHTLPCKRKDPSEVKSETASTMAY